MIHRIITRRARRRELSAWRSRVAADIRTVAQARRRDDLIRAAERAATEGESS